LGCELCGQNAADAARQAQPVQNCNTANTQPTANVTGYPQGPPGRFLLQLPIAQRVTNKSWEKHNNPTDHITNNNKCLF
jgi:hypothetical protein